MRHERWRERVAGYVDGELPEARRTEVEAHLAACPACREEAEAMRRLLAAARALPRSVEPRNDVWPGVAAALEDAPAQGWGSDAEAARPEERPVAGAGRRRAFRCWLRRQSLWSARGWLVAAAVLLVVVSTGLTALLLTRATPTLPVEAAPGSPGGIPAVAGASGRWWEVEEGYLRAAAELRATLAAQRERLEPEAWRAIERNLAIIDGAIVEAREALAADPGNPEVVRMLSSVYERKLEVLRHVAALPAGT